MRILQIVTLMTPDGAYGGPVRVAMNQSAELIRLGHQVVVAGAHSGYATPPRELDQVPIRLFAARRVIPATGFSGLAAPGLMLWLRKHAKDFDVIHVHLARDLVTLPCAWIAIAKNVPVVVQTHGMIVKSSHPLSGPLDRLLTLRVLSRAKRVLHLTQTEKVSLIELGAPPANLAHLPNGVPWTDHRASPEQGADILYLARLQERKRPVLLIRAATSLLRRRPEATLSFVGPDEGQLREMLTTIDRSPIKRQIRYEGVLPPESTLARMAQSSIYVLPSVDEPYPMSVLEAMSVGIPVIVSDSCGLAQAVRDFQAGLVVESSEESLQYALERLIDHPQERASLGANGAAAATEHFSIGAVGKRLERIYDDARGALTG